MLGERGHAIKRSRCNSSKQGVWGRFGNRAITKRINLCPSTIPPSHDHWQYPTSFSLPTSTESGKVIPPSTQKTRLPVIYHLLDFHDGLVQHAVVGPVVAVPRTPLFHVVVPHHTRPLLASDTLLTGKAIPFRLRLRGESARIRKKNESEENF